MHQMRWTARLDTGRIIGTWIVLAGLLGPFTMPAWGQDAPAPDTQPSDTPAYVQVTAERLNVRSRADANAMIVTRLKQGDVLRVVSRDQYGWYAVEPPADVFSLVSSEYIDRRDEDRGVVSTRSGALRVRVGSVVQRVDPLQSEVQARLEPGTAVEIVGEQDGWYQIVPPDGTPVYVYGEHVQPLDPAQARRILARQAAERRPPDPAATQPAREIDLSGEWGQQLEQIELALEVEGEKPYLRQSFEPYIEQLRPLARQAEAPGVARVARAWVVLLEQRKIDQRIVRDAEEILRREARDRAQFEREQERIKRLWRRISSRPAFDARGVLLESYAVKREDGSVWYRLQDPVTESVVVYVEFPPGSNLVADDFLGEYVGVLGRRRLEAGVGADVLRADNVIVLRELPPAPSTRPARPRLKP